MHAALHADKKGHPSCLGYRADGRSNVKALTEGPDAYHTSIPGVFAASGVRRGQALIVWAIRKDHQCACAVDERLIGKSDLPG